MTNAGLEMLQQVRSRYAVFFVSRFFWYMEQAAKAPIGNPQNMPMPRAYAAGFLMELPYTFCKRCDIIINGRSVGTITSNHRFKPLKAPLKAVCGLQTRRTIINKRKSSNV